jgi:transcriptional regulator CtsR
MMYIEGAYTSDSNIVLLSTSGNHDISIQADDVAVRFRVVPSWFNPVLQFEIDRCELN